MIKNRITKIHIGLFIQVINFIILLIVNLLFLFYREDLMYSTSYLNPFYKLDETNLSDFYFFLNLSILLFNLIFLNEKILRFISLILFCLSIYVYYGYILDYYKP